MGADMYIYIYKYTTPTLSLYQCNLSMPTPCFTLFNKGIRGEKHSNHSPSYGHVRLSL